MKLLLSCLFIVLAIGSSAATFAGPWDTNAIAVSNVSACHSLCKNFKLYGNVCPFGFNGRKLIAGFDCKPGFCRVLLGGFCITRTDAASVTTTTPAATTAASTTAAATTAAATTAGATTAGATTEAATTEAATTEAATTEAATT